MQFQLYKKMGSYLVCFPFNSMTFFPADYIQIHHIEILIKMFSGSIMFFDNIGSFELQRSIILSIQKHNGHQINVKQQKK